MNRVEVAKCALIWTFIWSESLSFNRSRENPCSASPTHVPARHVEPQPAAPGGPQALPSGSACTVHWVGAVQVSCTQGSGEPIASSFESGLSTRLAVYADTARKYVALEDRPLTTQSSVPPLACRAAPASTGAP